MKNKFEYMLYIGLVVFVGLLVMNLVDLASGQSPRTSSSAVQWEYASYDFNRSLQHWKSPTQNVLTFDRKEFYKKLGLKPTQSSNVTVANWAGKQGWELVSVHAPSVGNVEMWFKRQKRNSRRR